MAKSTSLQTKVELIESMPMCSYPLPLYAMTTPVSGSRYMRGWLLTFNWFYLRTIT